MDPLVELGQHLTRRQFLGRTSGLGLGAMALASLLDRDRAAAAGDHGPSPIRRRRRGLPQFRPAGEAGDLPVPVGRAVADGPLRREAPAAPPPGDRAARLDPDGPAADGHDLAAGALPGRGQPIPVRPTRPERGRRQRAAAAHRERRRPRSASSSRCTPRRSITTRRSPSSRPGPSLRAGPASAPGWPTAWGARTTTCRRSSS